MSNNMAQGFDWQRAWADLQSALAAKEQGNAELRTQMAALLRVDDPHTVLTSLEVLLKDADARAIAAEARAEGLAAALEGVATWHLGKRYGDRWCWCVLEDDEPPFNGHEHADYCEAARAALDADRTQVPGAQTRDRVE